jgi:hypothetical protein
MNTMRKRDQAVMVREVDSEFLLLDTEFNLIHKLNQTASFIWQTIDKVHSTVEIARLLANEYEVEEDVAIRDVVETLIRLRELKLVVVA